MRSASATTTGVTADTAASGVPDAADEVTCSWPGESCDMIIIIIIGCSADSSQFESTCEAKQKNVKSCYFWILNKCHKNVTELSGLKF